MNQLLISGRQGICIISVDLKIMRQIFPRKT